MAGYCLMVDDQAYDLRSDPGCKNLVLQARSAFFLLSCPKPRSTSNQPQRRPAQDREALGGLSNVSGLLSEMEGEVFRHCTPPGMRHAETDADASAWPKRLLASGTHSDSVQLNISFANGLCHHDSRVTCYRRLLRCTMIAGIHTLPHNLRLQEWDAQAVVEPG